MANSEVLTLRGQVAVADLGLEDHLVLHTGVTGSVAWKSDTIEISIEDEGDWPILIMASAICAGAPRRNLLVLPGQTICLNGAFIPADLLVNGRTIRRVKLASVIYQDVVLRAPTNVSSFYGDFRAPSVPIPIYAEGLPVGLRTEADQFSDYDDVMIRTARTDLLARAAIPCTGDPGLSLWNTMDGIFIESRSCILGEISSDPTDHRRLGVKVGSLRVGGKEVPFDHPALQIGWHEPEVDGRWTNGHALIPNALLNNSKDVNVQILKTLSYPLDEDHKGRIPQPSDRCHGGANHNG
jgi:hypothetical protein